MTDLRSYDCHGVCTLTTVTNVTAIYLLSTSRVNGEAGNKITTHSHIIPCLMIVGGSLNDSSRIKVICLSWVNDVLFNYQVAYR